MKLASISQTKNQLSALIEQVGHGETVVITDRDRPVARLMPIAAEESEAASGGLALLERRHPPARKKRTLRAGAAPETAQERQRAGAAARGARAGR
ncbi:MAG: type II toxin-antitoxin system Phd/YefM family antitoxin [Rhodocyclaceae bacterium]|nr:type II toxin-antitoxin system Phd/YefM family antitoxin [Rhodocyclaceae bacterium]